MDNTKTKDQKNPSVDPEALKLRVQKMREMRDARQAARIQLLKDLHLKKLPRESIFLSTTQLTNGNPPTTKSVSRHTISVAQPPVNKPDMTFDSILSKSAKIKAANQTKPSYSRKTVLPGQKMPEKPTTEVLVKSPEKVQESKLSKVDNKANIEYTLQRLAKLKKKASEQDKTIKPVPQPPTVKINVVPDKKPLLPNKKNSEVKVVDVRPSRHTIAPKPVPDVSRKSLFVKFSTKTVSNVPKPAPSNSIPKRAPEKSKNVTFPAKKSILKPTVKTSRMTIASRPVIPNKNLNEMDQYQKSNLRRSLSTVHFKRMGPDEAKKCFKRTYSVGNIKRKEIEEELPQVFPPKNYVLPVESERKKSVSFFTPLRVAHSPGKFLNTPKPNELRKRLNDWLQKRGKSLSTYHHLKCFGVHSHNQAPSAEDPLETDDENKENIEVNDDDSFTENNTGKVVDKAFNWRNETNSTDDPVDDTSGNGILKDITPDTKSPRRINPMVSEALYDLNQLILEDYSWLQCAEWLRLIVRECGDNVKNISAYWECRAALEERRGDFVRTFDCFDNALKQGAQTSNIEASLDSLLEKFMKLNLHPSYENVELKSQNSKLVDVKNVFKSSLIRFAITRHNADENKDDNPSQKKYVATPVRRSSRISTVNVKSNATGRLTKPPENDPKDVSAKLNGANNVSNTKIRPIPKERKHLVQLCESLRNVDDEIKPTLTFVPNKALNFNDCL